MRVRIGLFICIALTLLVGAHRIRRHEVLRAVHVFVGRQGLSVLSTLGHWEEAFGPSQVIQQADGGHTFFYWPYHGIAVFTHPLYRGQFERAPGRPREWKVTSIIIPVKKHVRPHVPPVKGDTRVAFKHLATITLRGKPIHEVTISDLRQLYLFSREITPGTILLSNIPILGEIAYPNVRVYMTTDGIDEIEVSHTDWLLEYD